MCSPVSSHRDPNRSYLNSNRLGIVKQKKESERERFANICPAAEEAAASLDRQDLVGAEGDQGQAHGGSNGFLQHSFT